MVRSTEHIHMVLFVSLPASIHPPIFSKNAS
jgi:hypothetical protein